MEQFVLTEKNEVPNDELISSILGDTNAQWEQTFSYLASKGQDISVVWKYSDCGKYWVCQALLKKKTIFRIHIRQKNSFSIAFPIGDRMEPLILLSKLPDSIKNYYIDATRYNTTRYIPVDVEGPEDIGIVKQLIDLKLGN